jgi:microcystin-dependent protein
MTTPFIGEIQVFGFNFAPYQWAECNGQTLAIRQYTALFSLIGTAYGGNGQTTFQLPNLVSRIACSQGLGPGRTQRVIGESFGEDTVTLTQSEIPQHTHHAETYFARGATNRVNIPQAGYALTSPSASYAMIQNTAPNTNFNIGAIAPAGSSLPHNNDQPVLAVNFAIALYGEFPSFN